MLSIIELLRSRTVAGVVVDSLGLQLVSLTPDFSVEDLARRAGRSPRGGRLRAAGVPRKRRAGAPGRARRDRALRAAGQSRRGAVRGALSPRGRDGHAWGSARERRRSTGSSPACWSPARELTDVIDVGFIAEDPRTAQRIVNSTVQAFQTLNVQWARERSRRRGEFLAEQLAQTDSTLERAQAELSSFRSRQQLASSRHKLQAEQAALLTLDARREELEADRQTFGALARAAQGRATRPRARRRSAPWPRHRPWRTTRRSAGSISSS